ncbi:protein FAM133-like [Haliotis asinina]|uniref:protein FAM133-like n=1 Tax=Haliotis asinina TaxID=109174 RepID=UPI003531FCAF
MDKDSFFKERVLHRLYGDTDADVLKQEDNRTSHETSRESPSHKHKVVVKRKIYTVAPAPSDWGDNPDNCNIQTLTESLPISNEVDLSETSESDDDTEPTYKRRKRRGKRIKISQNTSKVLQSESKLSDVKSESSKQTDNSNLGELSKLTKNQKRKLKKKKRKEKLKESSASELNTEFVYVGPSSH